VTSYEDRYLIFAHTTAAQKLGFAAWLVQNVSDLDMSEDSMVDLTHACVALRKQQGVFLKAEGQS
jgi:hypothetical protein